MKALFVMDPISTVIYNHDTSFALMLGLQKEGVQIFHCLPQDLFASHEGAGAKATQFEVIYDPITPFKEIAKGYYKSKDFQLVIMRKDPPLDMNYMYATIILDQFTNNGSIVLNSPESLRALNEKTIILRYPNFIPKTLVSANHQQIRDFTEELGGMSIIKPLDGFAGYGIVKASLNDGNLASILEILTQRGKTQVMVQENLKQACEGDKRVWLSGGEVLGQIIRIPEALDFRANMRVGAEAKACDLSAFERKICEEVGKDLMGQGVGLIGLDLIGGKLTEINITSPTGIQEIDRIGGGQSCQKTVEYLMEIVEEGVN